MRFSAAFTAACVIVPLVNAWTIESYSDKYFKGTVARYDIGVNCVTTTGQLRHNTYSVRAAPGKECFVYYDDSCNRFWNKIDSEGWGNIGELQLSSVWCR
jgi:hypothetical protein